MRQRERYRSLPIATNAELTPSLMVECCGIDAACARLLDRVIRKMALSARGYDRVRKVARTIADLTDSSRIRPEHVAEALQFRMLG